MNYQSVIKLADALLNEARFIDHIENNTDYHNALEMMGILIEDYDNQKLLIDILSKSIEEWENKSEEFESFNAAVKTLD